jgi:lipopolysaccharide/colanic/teichoic acid biosynthesis glycosyltransferase
MTSTLLSEAAGVKPTPPANRPSIWGFDARRLHDAFWASRGVQVVRPGQQSVDLNGPQVYLLLNSDFAVLMSVKKLLRRMRWTGAQLFRIRLSDLSGNTYRERIVAAQESRLVRIDRIYPRRSGGTARVGVTFDAGIAARWAAQTPGQDQWTRPRRRDGTTIAVTAEGRFFDLQDPNEQRRCLNAIVAGWRDPGRLIPGIYQWKERVWLHESSRIDPASRIIGPVWVGAHNELAASEPVIGPHFVHDARSIQRPRIDWGALQLPSFPLMPSIRGRITRRVTKRLFDIGLSLVALAVTLPIYPLIMLAIYIEDGRPFFFGHKRQTIGGRDFLCWKFRTMVKDAEALKVRLQAKNICDGPQFFIADDPRLLRSGRFLRRFQFDELPQFFNVLRGQMSVVGPRPSPDKENQFCPAWREARLSVRPGVTGLWQVRRTRLPETDFQEWIRYDLEYVQHQSWRLDLWIILQTVRQILRV